MIFRLDATGLSIHIIRSTSLILFIQGSTHTSITMSFGLSVGDFLASIQLANKIRKGFIDSPKLFDGLSDEYVV
jgi:hypothetical protein